MIITFCNESMTNYYFDDSKHSAWRNRVLYIQHDPTTSCSLNRLPQYTFLLKKAYFLAAMLHARRVAATVISATKVAHAQRYLVSNTTMS